MAALQPVERAKVKNAISRRWTGVPRTAQHFSICGAPSRNFSIRSKLWR